MAGPNNKASKRQQRAQRILASAAELIERWGYKKTTIDDIARQAGVAKGTIYLHWKSREELFEALLANEILFLVDKLQKHLTTDPAGATLRALINYSITTAMERPLIKALLAGEAGMLGEIIHTNAGAQLIQIRLQVSRVYLTLLRQHGMLRTDQGIDTQLKMMTSISAGFFISRQFMPPELSFTDKEIATYLAETLHCTFEAPTSPTPETLQEITCAFQEILQQFKEKIQAQQGLD